MNLSKGRIGEDNSRLIGGMLITKIQLAAMERVDTPEEERQDFFLYVDEFQNFATPSFANILSEARKYRLSLIMAHQYVMQLDEIVANAVFGNVGTIVSFRVGGADSEILAKEFAPVFLEEDIVNLAKYQIMLKLMIDGVASQPFSAMTMPPIGSPTDAAEKVIRVSRERYARKRDVIENKVLRWSGLGGESEMSDDDDEVAAVKDYRKQTSGARNDDQNKPTRSDDRRTTSAAPVAKAAFRTESRPPDTALGRSSDKRAEVSPNKTLLLNDLLPKNSLPPRTDNFQALTSKATGNEPKDRRSEVQPPTHGRGVLPFKSAEPTDGAGRKRRRRRRGSGRGNEMTGDFSPRSPVSEPRVAQTAVTMSHNTAPTSLTPTPVQPTALAKHEAPATPDGLVKPVGIELGSSSRPAPLPEALSKTDPLPRPHQPLAPNQVISFD